MLAWSFRGNLGNGTSEFAPNWAKPVWVSYETLIIYWKWKDQQAIEDSQCFGFCLFSYTLIHSQPNSLYSRHTGFFLFSEQAKLNSTLGVCSCCFLCLQRSLPRAGMALVFRSLLTFHYFMRRIVMWTIGDRREESKSALSDLSYC